VLRGARGPARGPVRLGGSLTAALAGLAAFTLGVLLGTVTGGPEPAPAGATPLPAATVTTVVTRPVAPPACLAAIRQGDATIRLLGADERSRRLRQRQLGELLKSYTVAAQSCRKEASRR